MNYILEICDSIRPLGGGDTNNKINYWKTKTLNTNTPKFLILYKSVISYAFNAYLFKVRHQYSSKVNVNKTL